MGQLTQQVNYLKEEVKLLENQRKKELLEQYKYRHPDMGVISLHIAAADEIFLGISKDVKADFNSNRFKLITGSHPNKQLQELWKQYGEASVEFSVVKPLEYEDPQEDHTEQLEALLLQCLEDMPRAKRIWR